MDKKQWLEKSLELNNELIEFSKKYKAHFDHEHASMSAIWEVAWIEGKAKHYITELKEKLNNSELVEKNLRNKIRCHNCGELSQLSLTVGDKTCCLSCHEIGEVTKDHIT